MLGTKFPEFTLQASGPKLDLENPNFATIKYTHDMGISVLGGHYTDAVGTQLKVTEGQPFVLYFWPMDFTFVCPTEIIEFEKSRIELEKRGYFLFGCSTDSIYTHNAWRSSREDLATIGHWWISDIKRELITALGIENEQGVASRATYIIDKNIRYVSIYPDNIGRNTDEIIRIVDGLGTRELCACNREIGGEVLRI